MSEELEDVATDTNVDVEETTNSNETSEQEDTGALQEKLSQAEKAKSQLTARAKKAEEELKKLRELKLIARGLSDEEIEQAKIIARGREIPLTEAIKDPLFQSYQAILKEKERKEKAKLGASKGSGESQDSSLIKQNMSREEHEAVFKKVMGQ